MRCTNCGQVKSSDDFYKDRTKRSGHHGFCKDCFKQSILRYRKTERYLMYRRAYGKTEKAKKYRKKYVGSEEFLKKRRIYSTTAEYRKKRREYRARNESVGLYQKKYIKTEKYKKWRRRYRLERFKNNPKLRLDTNMGIAVWEALKGKKAWRKWGSLTGYTLEALASHLEKQFDQFMTWDNYGPYWHVDHIIPRSVFHYKTAEDPEFKRCWALENLQPLEKITNIKKSNKLLS